MTHAAGVDDGLGLWAISGTLLFDRNAIDAKKLRVLTWLDHSQATGTLQRQENTDDLPCDGQRIPKGAS